MLFSRLLARLSRWQIDRHDRLIAGEYAPRLSAYRDIVTQGKVKQRKVIPFLNLQQVRDKRRRMA